MAHVIGLGFRMGSQYTLTKWRKSNGFKLIRRKGKVNYLLERMDISILQMTIHLLYKIKRFLILL